MAILLQCGGCQTHLNAPDGAAGKAVKCPRCATVLGVPAAVTATPPTPTPSVLVPSTDTPAPSLSLPPLPPEWQARIDKELEPGEEVVWTGQPDLTMTTVRHLTRVAPHMAVLAVFFVFLTGMNLAELRQGQFFWVVVVGTLGTGLVLLPLYALWERRQARRTRYFLTTQRALIFQPSILGRLHRVSYLPNQLTRLTFQSSWLFGPEAGDVVFRKETKTKWTFYMHEGRVEQSRRVRLFGFLLLRDAHQVESLIIKHLLAPLRKSKGSG